ncbi:MFS transporter [Fructilactobacillus lindneri]|uniref:Transport protein n=2 Tax=Fructilactobacillus lindneri TaxID=53444 RepID=A0A0R2JNK5_9LACO|nr:MFS transporter [Fructilactobacillus lindneri]ANZ57840.1 MFS transporter [Fructilactobacillus lindneri]ANZ59109.1 MFS transporter [Fructilactobacillus lindneri]KRN78706.1 transport protein [Fructilactobacillus lindneri DSM 20690 = JCM 11027]POG98161.1 MFS transporter [Fructilactobacillus lindneri]POH01723.1 MFS transporter [Fructilactobacillus lindneri]
MTKRKYNPKWILILTSLGFFMSMMDSMIVTTASTAIRSDFHISVDMLQWALNAYNITIAAVLLVGVALGEKYGRRKIYNLGILVFTIGSVLCALSPNIGMLITARIIQGVGASVMTPMSMAILTNSIPDAERGKALGIWSGIGGLALIIGPSLGGLIVSQLSWQWIFWINVPIGIVTIFLSNKFLPESKGSSSPIKPLDALLVIISFATMILSLTEITTSKNIMLPLAIGAFSILIGIWFIIRQHHEKYPMIPLNLFKSRIFSGGNIATFMLYASMYGVVFFLPQFLQTVAHNNALGAGLKILPWTGTLVVVAPFAGKAVDRFGEKIIAILGLLLQGLGYLLLAIFVTAQTSYAVMVIPLIISGAGLSMAGPALQKAVLDAVNKQEIGKASGIYNVFRLLGGAVGTAIAVIVFYKFGGIISTLLFANGFKAAMLSSAIVSFIGMFFCIRFKR